VNMVEKEKGINLNIKLSKADYKKLGKGKKLIVGQGSVAGTEITLTIELKR